MNNLEECYDALLDKYSFEKPLDASNINRIIHVELEKFLSDAENPAIYCYGEHTRNLISDFVFELKKVKVIIDNYLEIKDSGYKIIKKDEIGREHVDAVIVSSYGYMDQIVSELEKEYPDVKVLNIYEKLSDQGIVLHYNYYFGTHPYHNYYILNQLQRELVDSGDKEENYYKIINKYLHIKDFKSAIRYCREVLHYTGKKRYEQMMADFEIIYNLELECAGKIGKENVLMLCMDGLRNQDVNQRLLPEISKYLCSEWMQYSNTYSYSTSTYESLVPAYSENTDMHTRYYDKNSVVGKDCRFLQTALSQNRAVYFYTDCSHYVEHDNIHYSNAPETITQKFWNFIVDGQKESNGLFYIHGLYETHFAFSNPYTKAPLLADGSALMFDFLSVKGGKLRTDYVQQHDDALSYIDDVVAPILKRLKCNVVFFADHGNLLMDKNSSMADIKSEYLQCGEVWLRIPFFIRSQNNKAGVCEKLHSLMSINDVVISLLTNKRYEAVNKKYIKIGRSQIYNPDFLRLYKLLGEEKRLQAFEGFIFPEGYKLVIYADGCSELYDLNDNELFDDEKIGELLTVVSSDITVRDR